jgi:DNA-nicking Smr family endonuclease
MRDRRDRDLSHEERILWARVARSVRPLAGRPPDPLLEEQIEAAVKEIGREEAAAAAPPLSPAAPPRQVHAPSVLDETTRQKLTRGRLALGGAVDLHGLTQKDAHALLHAFLLRAHAEGDRYVLVITGKGASLGSDGVLRRTVPGWLRAAPLRNLVSAFAPAGRRHGGEGALYVRLKRQQAERRP